MFKKRISGWSESICLKTSSSFDASPIIKGGICEYKIVLRKLRKVALFSTINALNMNNDSNNLVYLNKEYFNDFLSYSLPNAKSVVNKVNTLFYAIKNFIFIGKTGQVHL
jgi:hypothetical protein